MKKHTRTIDIGNTDENADWIKTSDNRRSERRVHEEVQNQIEKEQQAQE